MAQDSEPIRVLDIEAQRVESLSPSANYGQGVNALSSAALIDFHVTWLRPGLVLELGPAEGYGTERLLAWGFEVWCCEGSSELAERLQERLPEVRVFHSLFEEFQPPSQVGGVVMGHVLEHVRDPLALLLRAREWLMPGGRVLIGVPNASSLHRQLGVQLQLINSEKSLNESDLRVGHRRVFDWDDLRTLVREAGFHSVFEGGYWLKMAPNEELDRLPRSVFMEHLKIGRMYPDVAAEIVMVIEAND